MMCLWSPGPFPADTPLTPCTEEGGVWGEGLEDLDQNGTRGGQWFSLPPAGQGPREAQREGWIHSGQQAPSGGSHLSLGPQPPAPLSF